MSSQLLEKKFRLPEWLEETRRWRIRIGYHFGRNGRRTERPFYWSAPDNNGGTPPPLVIAEAVQYQKEWLKIKAEWKDVQWKLQMFFPDRNWSMPVWCSDEMAKIAAQEAAEIEQAVMEFQTEQDELARQQEEDAARWVSKHGLAALLDALKRVPVQTVYENIPQERRQLVAECLKKDSATLFNQDHERLVQQFEVMRATALNELQPSAKRSLVQRITIRAAVEKFVKEVAEDRMKLKTSFGISETSSDIIKERVRAAFGQSSNPENPPIRSTKIAFDAYLHSLDDKIIAEFANEWHEIPEGITSERTIKNYLLAARAFFIWCGKQAEFGWQLPEKCLPLLTAGNVTREPIPFDPDVICQIIEAGGERVRMYALFGLCCGYYQSDIEWMFPQYVFALNGERYVQKFRRKEERIKQGRRPLKVRHWIAPEFAALIDSETRINSNGTLFNTIRGTPLTAGAVHERWYDSYVRAEQYLMFSQLRKMGYNAIKRLGGDFGPAMAEFWDGHAKGVSEAYDDGVWSSMNDVERLWGEELRKHGILASVTRTRG